MPTTPVEAAAIAQRLALRFLEGWNYVFSDPLSRPGLEAVLPAAGAPEQLELDRYFDDLGFTGLAVHSVGYEKGVDESRVHVYLTKGSRQVHKLLREHEDVPITINRMGKVIIKPETAAAVTSRGHIFRRNGRIACGSSCVPSGENYAGTFGALVTKQAQPGAVYALSNNHVFAAANHTPVGMPILSPSTIDTGPTLPAPREICRHSEISELRSGVPTLVQPCIDDVALAIVNDPQVVSSWQGEGPNSYDTPANIGELRSGMKVKKVGRTTGITTGSVEAFLNTPFPIPYKFQKFSATVWFQNVWTVKSDGSEFALPGDSGSLVVTEDGTAAVGLVFAASPGGDYGIVVSMKHVERLFSGISLISQHGV